MKTRQLHTGWTVRETGGRADVPADVAARRFSATVPGSVHLDLMANGALANPYLDRNEDGQHWIGSSTWTYETQFGVAANELANYSQHDLVFDGLDTVASVSLNGAVVARTENMHRQYTVDVTDQLRVGSNDLRVDFLPVTEYAERMRTLVGEKPSTYDQPFNYVRKMAANFGWDWGPTLVTAGIWKPLTLRSWNDVRFTEIRPQIGLRTGGVDSHISVGTVRLDVEFKHARPVATRLVAKIAGVDQFVEIGPGERTAALNFEIADIEAWWPVGHGRQTLYELEVTLEHENVTLDSWSRRVGFRSAELRTVPDELGTSFEFVINGTPIFARGVNWIPDDCFVSRVGADQYRARLLEAREANINLVRVWGGGIYEKDEFYEACNELGLLVWQDFLFACAAYAEDEPLSAEVAAEARDNVVRLMPHPSLVLWNGNNECIWGFEDWGWKDSLAGASWGSGYYFDVLPSLLAETDPSRSYWPGSPYSGALSLDPNDPAHGNSHIWDVWNEREYGAYATYRPRFVSEFGFQGPANWSTIEGAITERPIDYESDTMLAHQKAENGMRKLAAGLEPYLPAIPGGPVTSRTNDWHYLTQLNQAKAVEFGIRHFRALGKSCRGAIVWQLNDCWPATSWSAIDSEGRRKPLWYSLRRAFSPLLVTIDDTTAEGTFVAIVNDSTRTAAGELVLQRRDLNGALLAEFRTFVDVAASTSIRVEATNVARTENPTRELLWAGFDGQHDIHFFLPTKDVEIPPPACTVEVSAKSPTVLGVTVTASTFLVDLVLNADRIDPAAVVEEQLVTLLPGEAFTFLVTTTADASDPRWLTAPVIRSVGDVFKAVEAEDHATSSELATS